MEQCLFICEVNLSIEAYMTKWTPKNGEIRLEPENEYDKYAVVVERCGDVVEHISKGRSARFVKTVSYFYVQAMKTNVGLK